MGLFDFVKDAGEKLFGGSGEAEVQQRGLDDVLADKQQAVQLTSLVGGMGLNVENLRIKLRSGVALVEGVAATMDDREKTVLMVGNTQGVSQVDDRMSVAAAAAAAPTEAPVSQTVMYTVQSGDSLSKIAKAQYGDAMKYMVIFEANQPMLKDPNKIYPGQVLRIPSL